MRATRKADGHKGDSVDSDDDGQRYTLDDGAGPCTPGQIMDDPAADTPLQNDTPRQAADA